MSSSTLRPRPTLITFVVAAVLSLAWAGPSASAPPFTVCALSFNSPDELQVFRTSLPPEKFEIVDLTPQLLPGAPGPAGDAGMAALRPRLVDVCQPDLQCDVVVYSAEFAGRFFGKYGFSLSLQDMEEAACQARCGGLFHAPVEVFLLACNTLATKDEDSRTPREYLQVLIDHGFDQATAERVVQQRYGPVGPSFREALRRVFLGVPRLYGFSSVAPQAVYTVPKLSQYFRTKGDYAAYLSREGRGGRPNRELLAAFKGTDLMQTAGLRDSEPAAADRDRVCALYDDGRSVVDRLEIMQQLMARADFLSFLPTMEIFLQRHPPHTYTGRARDLFVAVQGQAQARTQVLALAEGLHPSALKLEVALFATHLEWMTPDELRTMAVDSTKQLLARPFTSEVVDIVCEVTKHEPVGDEFDVDDLPAPVFAIPEGMRLLECLAPTDPRIDARIAGALDSPDVSLRLWAAYVLSKRLPLEPPVLEILAAHLNDESPDVRARLRWAFEAHPPVPDRVREAVRRRDPGLAASLRDDDDDRR